MAESEVARVGRLRRNATYRAKNREILSEKSIQWRRENPDKAAKTIKASTISAAERRKTIPDVAEARRNQVRLYRARKAAQGGEFHPDDITARYKLQDGLCAYCGVALGDEYETDHHIPVSRGGLSDWDNLRVTCRPCNRRKHDLLPDEWDRKMGRAA